MKIKMYCLNSDKKFMYDYINSILKYIEFDLFYYNENIVMQIINDIKQYDILIFLQEIPKAIKNIKKYKKNLFVLNTEQLSRKTKLNALYFYDNIIDYSLENIKLMDRKVLYFPYGINYDEIYNLNKTLNVCFIGAMSKKRQYIIDKLYERGITVDIINNYSKEKDDILFKYKVLINIHYDDDYNVFEHLRCDRCLFNRMIIISEKSYDDDLNPLKNKIIFIDYDNFVNKVTDVINDYIEYYSKLFWDYNEFMIDYQNKIRDAYNKNYKLLSFLAKQ